MLASLSAILYFPISNEVRHIFVLSCALVPHLIFHPIIPFFVKKLVRLFRSCGFAKRVHCAGAPWIVRGEKTGVVVHKITQSNQSIPLRTLRKVATYDYDLFFHYHNSCNLPAHYLACRQSQCFALAKSLLHLAQMLFPLAYFNPAACPLPPRLFVCQ